MYLPTAIDRGAADLCRGILDDQLYRHLSTISARIPKSSIHGMRRDYSESLGKTMHVKTALLERKAAISYRVAESTGLLKMLSSPSLRQFAEMATGLPLVGGQGFQVLCYEPGHYVGPHNDHHPEDKVLKAGYVDFHIIFSNSAVAHQWLVYEKGSHFCRVADINVVGGIAVYRLPFWHYTTPLVGKVGFEKDARRWVLLVSFAAERSAARYSHIQPSSERARPRN